MTIQPIHYGVLRHVADDDVDLREIGEFLRERLIDLIMHEPPLIDVDADRVFLTQAGRDILHARSTP